MERAAETVPETAGKKTGPCWNISCQDAIKTRLGAFKVLQKYN